MTEQQNSELFVYWIKIAFRICGNVFDAEDVVQRSCLELLQKHVDPIDEKNGGLMHRVVCCRAPRNELHGAPPVTVALAHVDGSVA